MGSRVQQTAERAKAYVAALRSPSIEKSAVEQTSILAKAEASVTAEAGRVQQTAELAKAYVADLTGRASVRANQLKEKTLETANQLKLKTVETVSDPQVQVTAAAAVAGGATLGTAAGTAGVVVGGVVGAVVGIVPALFTFGLSIPLGAAVGAAVGGGTGVTVGGTTGLVGGGAAGYYGYAHKDEIRQGAGCAYEKLSTYQACDGQGVRDNQLCHLQSSSASPWQGSFTPSQVVREGACGHCGRHSRAYSEGIPPYMAWACVGMVLHQLFFESYSRITGLR